MQIRIEGSELPGRDFSARGSFEGRANVHVGVQRKDRPAELLGPRAGDESKATWTLDCRTAITPAGPDVTGPYIQGRPGQRFIYLSWGEVDASAFTMFRRAKLMIEDVPPEILRAGIDAGLLVARLGLSDAHGRPLCARVRPPLIKWSTS